MLLKINQGDWILKLFTNKQIELINKRANGDRSDPNGMFARIKPKIKEIINILETPDALNQWKKVLKGK